MNIGDNIRNIRKSKKMSQTKLGTLLGVSQAMIAQYENGARIPKIETIYKIANALNVEIFDIMEVPFDEEDIPFRSLEDDTLSLMTKNEQEFQLLTDYRKLNSEVQEEAAKRIGELTEIDPSATGNINRRYTISVDIDTEHPFYILQEKIKRGESLTPEESTLFREYMQKGIDSLKKSMNKLGKVIEANYKLLNEEGQKKADEQIDRAIEQIELLTKIPEYQKESLENYVEFFSDKTPKYWEDLKQTLQQVDSGNALTLESPPEEE